MAADKATPSKKTPKKEKSSNDTSKLDASSNEDDEDAGFDALFSESKTPASVGKKRNKSAEGNNGEADGSSKPKKAKTPTAKSEDDDLGNESTGAETDDGNGTPNHVNNRKSASSAVSSFLDRPYLNRPPPSSPTLIDMSSTSKVLAEKDIQPSTLKFGFLGLGIMGSGIVKNLLNSGHSITVWNRTLEKCKDFVKAGAKEALTPGD